MFWAALQQVCAGWYCTGLVLVAVVQLLPPEAAERVSRHVHKYCVGCSPPGCLSCALAARDPPVLLFCSRREKTGMGRPSAPRSPLGTIQSSPLAWRRRARRARQRRGRPTASSSVRGDHQVAELPRAHRGLGEELHRFGSLGGRCCCWRRLQGELVCVMGWRCSFAVFGGQS